MEFFLVCISFILSVCSFLTVVEEGVTLASNTRLYWVGQLPIHLVVNNELTLLGEANDVAFGAVSHPRQSSLL